MRTWFTSDTHFRHENVLKTCNPGCRGPGGFDQENPMALTDSHVEQLRTTIYELLENLKKTCSVHEMNLVHRLLDRASRLNHEHGRRDGHNEGWNACIEAWENPPKPQRRGA